MKKTMNYQIGFKNYKKILCQSQEEIEAVRELNKMHDAFNKSQITYHEKILSVDALSIVDYAVKIVDDAPNPLEKLIYQEKYEPLYEAIDKLTKKQKEVFNSHVLYLESFRDIAKRLNINPKTAEEYYKTTLKKLRNLLKNQKF